MEYDSFSLSSPSTGRVFLVSGSATGDAGDMVRTANSAVHGSPFYASGACFDARGPWWYANSGSCANCRLFGPPNTQSGVEWGSIGTLSAARMMVRLVQ